MLSLKVDTRYFRRALQRAIARMREVIEDVKYMDREFRQAAIRAENQAVTAAFLRTRPKETPVAHEIIQASTGLTGAQKGILACGRFSGFRDWTRGRHWDRRSRYGER